MEDFSAPSFSLGFELDIADLPTEGEEEEKEKADHPSPLPPPGEWTDDEEISPKPSVQEPEDFEETNTLDMVNEEDPPRRNLKRLRRGQPPLPLAKVATPRPSEDVGCLINDLPPSFSIYDDIEEFSSPEKGPQRCTDNYPSTQSHVTCGTTKFSLFHRGFIRDKLSDKQTTSKVTPASTSATISTRLEASNVKYPFPRLTISPIRKINLVESDSDDSSTSKGDFKRNEEADVALKKGNWLDEKNIVFEGQKNFSATLCKTESSWKDFRQIKDKKIETPALDEFCEEYFKSARDQNVNQLKAEKKSSGFSSTRGQGIDYGIDGCEDFDPCKNNNEKMCINWNLSSPQPSSYQYFYHTDPRIRALVRQRLPHFFPLGNISNGDGQLIGAKNIDYMSQFNSTCSSGKVHVPEKLSRSSSSKKQNKKSIHNVIETSDATGSWVNPRSKTTVPKDAGKRRVSAVVLQSGQWFTDQDGRKVYVSKDGEQATGRVAYMKYKKETVGFRKPKKKATAKRSWKS